MTQSQIISRLQLNGWDISRQVYSFVEDGSRMISDLELFALLRALGLTPSDLEKAFLRFSEKMRRSKRAS